MAGRERAGLEPMDDWQQGQLQLNWPGQTRYGLIRVGVRLPAAPRCKEGDGTGP